MAAAPSEHSVVAGWAAQVGAEEKAAARARAVAAIDGWLDKFDVVVVGPGLGRDELILETIAEVRSLGL